jgi:uncharacterized protein
LPIELIFAFKSALMQRIIGFDLARAYAIFGMFIVNFNVVFGDHHQKQGLGYLLNLFNGNLSSLFVILSGMGLSLLSRGAAEDPLKQATVRRSTVRRAWVLFVLGLALNAWWPADILHFYAAYMHLAVFLLFRPKKLLLWAAAFAVLIFHGLLFLVPYETAWNFETFQYHDFWTPVGLFRNTFYNGWNPVFPWIAFFLLGMYLGQLDWNAAKLRWRMAFVGLGLAGVTTFLQYLAGKGLFAADLAFYLQADYLPPFLPFMLSTTGVSILILCAAVQIGAWFEEKTWLQYLLQTGRMTLTHYIQHLTLGLVVLAIISGKKEYGLTAAEEALPPGWILLFSAAYFVVSVVFSVLWTRRFGMGPFEKLLRVLSGTIRDKAEPTRTTT